MIDDEFRLQTLLGHLTVGRLFSKDFKDGGNIETVAKKTLTVEKKSEGKRQNIRP